MSKNMKIALLIDADNASVSTLDYVLGEIADLGMANVRRAYGDWGSQSLKGWREALLANAIQPVQQIAYTAKGNASDMAMVIEAMDLLHDGDFDAFALMSSDSDFTPLVMRLRAANTLVYGFGKSQTPNAFKRACSVFFYVDMQDEPTATTEPKAEAMADSEATTVTPALSLPVKALPAPPLVATPCRQTCTGPRQTLRCGVACECNSCRIAAHRYRSDRSRWLVAPWRSRPLPGQSHIVHVKELRICQPQGSDHRD